MSYNIKKSDGTTLTTVPENEVVTNAASVALVGRGATSYGVAHSQNFVYLVENFAHTVPPSNALDGQLWYDKNIGQMKVRKGNDWVLVGSGASGSGNTVSGTIGVVIDDTSVLVFVAGGQVVSVVSPRDLANSQLPVSITLLSTVIPFQSRFPYGLQAGVTLANDPLEYIYQGTVPRAIAADFVGGGSPFAATTYIDLGEDCVTVSISSNAIVGAFSARAVDVTRIPTNLTVSDKVLPFKSVFPTGLVAGLTLAGGFGLRANGIETGSGSTSTIQDLINTFTSATQKATLNEALSFIISAGVSGADTASSYTLLRSEFTDALGATSFANALQILATAASSTGSSAADLTALETSITDGYTTAIATATQGIITTSTLNDATATALTQLTSSFESATGYSSFASAVNDLKTVATGTGSVVSQDTDLRTQFTNALAVGSPAGAINSVAKAMAKLKDYSTNITTNASAFGDLVTALKNLTGTGLQESSAAAINKLVSQSTLTQALATNTTTLRASIAGEMSPGKTTIADAVTEIIQSAKTTADGSSSTVDTNLRNLFVQLTNESAFPVTSVSEAITKLMSNTTKDQALSASVIELQNSLTGSTGTTTVASAKAKLTSAVTATTANSAFITDLQAKVGTELGQTTWATALQKLLTDAKNGQAASESVTALTSAFQNQTGSAEIATAVERLWTKASAAGTVAGWGVDVNAKGQIAGLQLLADSTQKNSKISIQAGQLALYNSVGAEKIPFRIENDIVYMDNAVLQDLSIGAEKLQQITFTPEVYFGSTSVPTTNSPLYNGQMVISTGSVPFGTKIIMFFSCNCTGSDSGGLYVNVVRQDGHYCQGTAEFGNPDEGGSAQCWTFTDTVPTAGTWSYTVYGRRFGSSSTLRNASFIGLIQKQLGTTTGTSTATAPDPVGGGGYYDPGTGGYVGGTGGDFSDGSCVAADSYMPDGRLARDVTVADYILALDYSDMDKTVSVEVMHNRIVLQDCVRIVSRSGIALVASKSTPITLRDGSMLNIIDALHKELAVQDDDGFRWEEIMSVEEAGIREVAHISANGATYAAGESAGRMIFTHNMSKGTSTQIP